MHPHTIRDAGLWTECWWHAGRSPSSLALEDTAYVISNKNIKFRLVWQYIFPLWNSPFLNEPWPTGHNGASGPCLHMVSFLHDRSLFGISRWHSWIVFTIIVFWKYSWADSVISMTESCWWVMQCHLSVRIPWTSNKGLWPCSLRTEISPVSLKLFMMLCTVDDNICKAFAIWSWET